MANPASKTWTSAERARLEAAAARALDSRRGRAQIAAAPRAGRFVGERLAGLTFPEKLQRSDSGAALTIVAHASAAPFVQHQQSLIIERANLAGAAIKRVQIRQGAPPARPANVRPLAKPLAPEEEHALAAALSSIASAPLRAALLRLGRAVSAR
jgi:hypothetical protein